MQHPLRNDRFESYLGELRSHLNAISQPARSRSLEETRQHLHSVMEQLMTEGWTEGDAVAEAVRRFGSASDIGKRLSHEWRLTMLAQLFRWTRRDLRVVNVRHDRDAIRYTLGMLGATVGVWAAFTLGAIALLSFQILRNGGDEWMHTNSQLTVALSALYFMSPIALGWLVGSKAGGRALMAIPRVIAGADVLTLVILVLPTMLNENGAAHRAVDDAGAWASIAAHWLCLSTAAAYLATCVKRGRFYRPTVDDFRYREPEAGMTTA